MDLDEESKDNIRLAIESHNHCVHDYVLCQALILTELVMRRGYPIASDEELEACGFFIADVTLENLILKGYVEMAGVSEDGDMVVGLTKDGKLAIEEIENKKSIYDCDFCGLGPGDCDCGGNE